MMITTLPCKSSGRSSSEIVCLKATNDGIDDERENRSIATLVKPSVGYRLAAVRFGSGSATFDQNQNMDPRSGFGTSPNLHLEVRSGFRTGFMS